MYQYFYHNKTAMLRKKYLLVRSALRYNRAVFTPVDTLTIPRARTMDTLYRVILVKIGYSVRVGMYGIK